MITRDVLLRTDRFAVVCQRITTSAGDREYVFLEKPDSVLSVLFSEDALCLLCVRRHLIQADCYELPGGRIEAGESPLEAAVRELREETGLEGVGWRLLGSMYPLPSVTTERVHIFAAHFCGGSAPKPQREEGIERVSFVPFATAREYAFRQLIPCSVDAYATLLFLEYREGNNKGGNA